MTRADLTFRRLLAGVLWALACYLVVVGLLAVGGAS